MNKKHFGLNPKAFLNRYLFKTEKLKQIPTRNGFGQGLITAGEKNKKIVALSADLTESTRVLGFKKKFPDRFIQLGVSEQSLASIAGGLSLAGKIPFIASYASFSPGRNWEQLRTAGTLQNTNIKIVGAHAGVSVGPDGATHQMTEDIALMRVLPRMQVVIPCDSLEAQKATLAIAQSKGPSYLRLARSSSPVFTTNKTPFKVGRGETFRYGDDVTIISSGPILYEALLASEILAQEKIQVRIINLHTIKPLDIKIIIKAAQETGAIITVEEAQAVGGLGGAIAETLGSYAPVPLERIGLPDRFGESGNPDELLSGLGLTAPYIIMAVHRILKRKNGKKVNIEPDYITQAKIDREKKQKEIMEEALKRTPKRWGGKKPDRTLKSRSLKNN